jgi:hypothetical protein
MRFNLFVLGLREGSGKAEQDRCKDTNETATMTKWHEKSLIESMRMRSGRINAKAGFMRG